MAVLWKVPGSEAVCLVRGPMPSCAGWLEAENLGLSSNSRMSHQGDTGRTRKSVTGGWSPGNLRLGGAAA